MYVCMYIYLSIYLPICLFTLVLPSLSVLEVHLGLDIPSRGQSVSGYCKDRHNNICHLLLVPPFPPSLSHSHYYYHCNQCANMNKVPPPPLIVQLPMCLDHATWGNNCWIGPVDFEVEPIDLRGGENYCCGNVGKNTIMTFWAVQRTPLNQVTWATSQLSPLTVCQVYTWNGVSAYIATRRH